MRSRLFEGAATMGATRTGSCSLLSGSGLGSGGFSTGAIGLGSTLAGRGLFKRLRAFAHRLGRRGRLANAAAATSAARAGNIQEDEAHQVRVGIQSGASPPSARD